MNDEQDVEVSYGFMVYFKGFENCRDGRDSTFNETLGFLTQLEKDGVIHEYDFVDTYDI